VNIKKHLPKPVERKLIQARIERALYDKLRAKLKKDGVEIKDFLEAAAKAYLEEK
jgi:hypothetical protein